MPDFSYVTFLTLASSCAADARVTQRHAGPIQVILDLLYLHFETTEMTFKMSLWRRVLNSQQVLLVPLGGDDSHCSACCTDHLGTAASPAKTGSVLELGEEEPSNWEEESLCCSTDQTSGEHLPWEATAALRCLLWAEPSAVPLQLWSP